ncbi:MarR family transcriptional regulator [Gymnodinialimonas sp.]
MTQLESYSKYFDANAPSEIAGAARSVRVGSHVLAVLEEIAASGPITKAQIVRRLCLSATIVNKTTAVLLEQGWVRTRYADGAFELSAKVDDFFSKAHVAPPEVREFAPVIAAVGSSSRMSVVIGIFQEKGTFCAIDATMARKDFGKARSFVFDDLAMAAQSILSQDQLASHISAYVKNHATPEEVSLIDSGFHDKNVAALVDDGLIWLVSKAGFTVPLEFATGNVGAIRFEARPPSDSEPLILREFSNRLRGARPAPGQGIKAEQLTRLVQLSLEFDDLMHDPREA